VFFGEVEFNKKFNLKQPPFVTAKKGKTIHGCSRMERMRWDKNRIKHQTQTGKTTTANEREEFKAAN
jgi:hypothetical protein